MKLNLNHLILFILFFTFSSTLSAQESALEKAASNADKRISQIRVNNEIDADSTFKQFSNWHDYPDIKGGKDYLFYYTDSLFGKVPFRVFVPVSYNSTRKSTCILLLHGAVVQSSFADSDSIQ